MRYWFTLLFTSLVFVSWCFQLSEWLEEVYKGLIGIEFIFNLIYNISIFWMIETLFLTKTYLECLSLLLILKYCWVIVFFSFSLFGFLLEAFWHCYFLSNFWVLDWASYFILSFSQFSSFFSAFLVRSFYFIFPCICIGLLPWK